MTQPSSLNAAVLAQHSIRVFEPFSDFLQGSPEEKSFDLSLLDVVRFAGHACPSMVGAFLITQEAVRCLFPDGVCVRGDLKVELPCGPGVGATGPIANVFSFITGAWGETGFGGLRGQFTRRNLLTFNSEAAPSGGFCFTRLSTGKSVNVFYDPSQVSVKIDASLPFQAQWRQRIAAILADPRQCVRSEFKNEEVRNEFR